MTTAHLQSLLARLDAIHPHSTEPCAGEFTIDSGDGSMRYACFQIKQENRRKRIKKLVLQNQHIHQMDDLELLTSTLSDLDELRDLDLAGTTLFTPFVGRDPNQPRDHLARRNLLDFFSKSRLKTLNLRETKMTDADVLAVVAGIRDNCLLETLDISCNGDYTIQTKHTKIPCLKSTTVIKDLWCKCHEPQNLIVSE